MGKVTILIPIYLTGVAAEFSWMQSRENYIIPEKLVHKHLDDCIHSRMKKIQTKWLWWTLKSFYYNFKQRTELQPFFILILVQTLQKPTSTRWSHSPWCLPKSTHDQLKSSEVNILTQVFGCYLGCFSCSPTSTNYRTCMASSVENRSFCEVPKYVINTRPHCLKLMKFTCYTHAQSCNTESCITTIAIQLSKVD